MAHEFVEVSEVAQRWRAHHSTVRRALRRDLPYLKVGGKILISVADLERYEAARKVHPGRAAGR